MTTHHTGISTRQADRLRQHGLVVTPGKLQGLPVLLLALVSTTTAALSCAPAHAPTGAVPMAARAHPVAQLRPRQPCRLKRPPHRPFRS